MAASTKKAFKGAFTVATITPGSNSGPKGGGKGVGKHRGSGSGGYKGAPTVHPVDSGERVLARGGTGAGSIYPPVYGGGKRQVTQTKLKAKGAKGGGYVPSSQDVTNSPSPI